jgi:uncharacterized protein (TIGR02466 family)
LIESFSILPYIFARSCDDNFEEIQDDLIDWMENYAKIYQSNHRSNVNGYQSPDNFYLDKSFSPFLNYMSDRIMSLIDVYKTHEEANIEFTPRLSNMWFNINYRGSYNGFHSHPGSALAGILYVNVPDDSGDIQFQHLDGHSLSLSQNTCYTLEPDDGDMYLFPASLGHSVEMNMQDEPRMSIAFNLYEFYE